jgi:hypothetical protein
MEERLRRNSQHPSQPGPFQRTPTGGASTSSSSNAQQQQPPQRQPQYQQAMTSPRHRTRGGGDENVPPPPVPKDDTSSSYRSAGEKSRSSRPGSARQGIPPHRSGAMPPTPVASEGEYEVVDKTDLSDEDDGSPSPPLPPPRSSRRT